MKQSIKNKLSKHLGSVQEMLEEAHQILDAEQETYDNKSERWQESEAGEKALETIGNLGDLISGLESAESALDNLVAE